MTNPTAPTTYDAARIEVCADGIYLLNASKSYRIANIGCWLGPDDETGHGYLFRADGEARYIKAREDWCRACVAVAEHMMAHDAI